MKTSMRVEGLQDLDAALADLPQSTAKGVVRRTLIKAGQPIVEDYANNVRRRSGTLAESAGVSTKLSRRQRRLHRKMFADDRAAVEVFAGAGPLSQAITEEFGTVNQEPQGQMRAAWDRNKQKALQIVQTETWSEISKTAARLARRRARQAAKG
ncbi:MAG: hypothetical protein ACK4MX_09530 [Thermaurantiacus sp.]